jgi:hypothetical protein
VSGLAFAQVEAILLFGNHTISEYLQFSVSPIWGKYLEVL